MAEGLRQIWDQIRKAILGKWGHAIREDDLAEPMEYEELCTFFGEQCKMKREDARREIDQILDQSRNTPLGV